MKVLALEFSTQRRSVAVAETTSFRVLGSASEANPRGSNGMVLVDRALAQARIAPAEIELLAVGLGPGSYAGIRSAIAIAQGWQLAREVRLLGISSVEVLVAEAQQTGISGEVTVIIDAQRREFYAARFGISKGTVRELDSLRIVPATALESAQQIIGPDAAELIRGATSVYPSAERLAHLATNRTDYRRGEELEPIYLRESSFVKAPPPRFGSAA